METGELTAEGFGKGDQLYQQRAKRVLPILVRQAKAQNTMFYCALAKELQMPNARNLNYVLGAAGGELQKLSVMWGEVIPPLTCVIVNQQDELPGNGIGWFVGDKASFRKLPLAIRRSIVDQKLAEIYAYKHWNKVLAHFGMNVNLASTEKDLQAVSEKATKRYDNGEGDLHRELKLLIASNPKKVGLPAKLKGELEHAFPSADRVDVLFRTATEWVGVEVKGSGSDEIDLERGLFQCIKYQALLEAEQKVLQSYVGCRTILVTAKQLTTRLEAIRATLGIQVCVIDKAL